MTDAPPPVGCSPVRPLPRRSILNRRLLVVAFVDELGVGRTWAYLASIPPVTVGLFVANRVWVFGEPR